MLLLTRTQSAQIRCVGENISIDPFALELVVDTFPDISSRQLLITRLAHIFQGRRTRPSCWTAQQLWHRDALIAFDAWRAGLSQREIAIIIYDEARVYGEWRSPDQTMKNRIARAIKRGRRLVAGGYRKLLA